MKHIAGGLQWAVFLIASSIAAPIAIGHVFGMDAAETALFIQRTMFVLGLACIVQAVVGHRMPINEGPAGLWWGIFVVYAGMVGVLYATKEDALQTLQSGMIYSGVLFILLAVLGLVGKMKKLFTPAVTFTYLMLLILQLSGTFVKGMLGIENAGDAIDIRVVCGSIIIVILMFIMMNHKVGWISRYSVLLAILIGWLLFLAIGKAPAISALSEKVIDFPDILVYGKPVWDGGMAVTALFITLLLIANMMASIRVMENLLKQSFSIETKDRVRQGSIASGINHMLAGLFSAIGPVPISGSAGFVGATRMASLKPFIIGSGIIVVMTLFPAVMATFAALPAPVAYAVTFAIFSKMVEMAFHELSADPHQQQAYKVVAIGLMLGVGLMFVPSDSFAKLPGLVAAILSNGLITGTITAVVIEQFLIWKNRRADRI
ncbi:purine permease [Sporosarcina sp. NCCP-2222]|uniref:purine/pyrimidine permease n=1 Tax=Sporosarcina sp. NCCP-2222 TaxID=2935073 RepID=UPI0020827526|nr:purine/pyrimidine permease [Sporosarcina sp. NCCP-2222]GKV57452.1 purine permease [Sporosarcina sp. NCCP-2222]